MWSTSWRIYRRLGFLPIKTRWEGPKKKKRSVLNLKSEPGTAVWLSVHILPPSPSLIYITLLTSPDSHIFCLGGRKLETGVRLDIVEDILSGRWSAHRISRRPSWSERPGAEQMSERTERGSKNYGKVSRNRATYVTGCALWDSTTVLVSELFDSWLNETWSIVVELEGWCTQKHIKVEFKMQHLMFWNHHEQQFSAASPLLSSADQCGHILNNTFMLQRYLSYLS